MPAWLTNLKNILTEHWGLKLLSLFLAIGFWFYALGEEMVEISRNVPLDIELPGEQFSIGKRSTESVFVRLKAPRSMLSVLSSADVYAYHKISSIAGPGEYSFRISDGEVKLPSAGIHVMSILPEIVTVMIDEAILKKLPIEPNFIGDPAYGYKVLTERVESDPNAVMVEGPRELLEKMTAIKTEPIDLTGRTRSFRYMAKLMIDSEIRVTADPVIDVFIPLRAEYSELEFQDVEVKLYGSPESGNVAVITPDKITFRLKGPKSELDALAQKGFMTYADVSSLKRGSHELPVRFVLPETVSVKDESPIVQASIEKIR